MTDIKIYAPEQINPGENLVHYIAHSPYPDFFWKSVALFPNHKIVCWKNDTQIIPFMSQQEKTIYNKYKYVEQKMQFFKYVILRAFGGIYIDINVNLKQAIPISNKVIVFTNAILMPDFVEQTARIPVRNFVPECPIRIRADILSCPFNSSFIGEVINLCELRVDVPIRSVYDISYTCGEDVISTVVANNPEYIYTFGLKQSAKFIESVQQN